MTDAHAGSKASIHEYFTGSSWQRCRVHYARNLLATVPRTHLEFVAAAFGSIFALGGKEEVEARWDDVTDSLADRLPEPADSMRAARTDVLAFAVFPAAHWSKITVVQPLERLTKKVKRRSNVVGLFPNERLRRTMAHSSCWSARSAPMRRIGAGSSETSTVRLKESRDTDPDQPALAG